MRGVFLLCFLSAAAFAGDAEDLTRCVEQIEAYSGTLKRRIPATVLAADRRLFHMTEAVPHLRPNGELAARTGNFTLLANSVEGCLLFKQRYEARAGLFQGLLACVVLLIVTLTVRAFLIMVAAPSALGVTHAESVIPSTDSRPKRDRR